MTRFAPEPGGAVGVVLTGRLDELATISTARRLADSLHVRLVGCKAATGLAAELIDDLASGAFDGWIPRSQVQTTLAGARLHAIVLSGTAWNRVAHDLWRHVCQTPIWITRRDPGPVRRVLIAAGSPSSGRMLLRRARGYRFVQGAEVWVAHAINPLPFWLLAACAAGYFDPSWQMGAPEFVRAVREEGAWLDLRPLLLRGPAGEVLSEAIRQIHPDVVLLGWHRHRLQHPRLAHPTAWRISHDAGTDVVLFDLDTPWDTP